MSSNTSYDSSLPKKPTCPICGHIVALSAGQCANCGNTNFYKVGSILRNTTCSSCKGDGKAQWTLDRDSSWQKPDKDYCCCCHGRGHILTYSVIDLRTNEVSSRHHDIDDSGNGSFRYREYSMPAVQPIHRGRTPRPVYFIDLCFYAIIILAVMYLIDLITSQ